MGSGRNSIRPERFAIFLLLLAVIFSGCSDESTDNVTASDSKATTKEQQAEKVIEPVFASLQPGEAFALITGEQELVIVDVRSPAERQQVGIADSIAIPLDQIMQGNAVLPVDKPLLLVCAVGGRSYAAALFLRKRGHLLLYNLRGGITAWEKAGLPLEYPGK